ncbi:MAG TPA: hypothetical protein EYQ21_07555 [Flavobacteriales bacterium]|jgi:hypothetical protein|nr:hypothetical protein [Flavobacteriales bacterium]HIK97165.1 hypothetical protein [Gammaproteobacteria bacterium]
MAENEKTNSFDLNITPHPQILGILAMASLWPIDALSELIDNSVDSFGLAQRLGEPVENPQIELFIPTLNDVRAGNGEFIIRDNGFGLDREGINNAVTAGFSGQTQFANLGLFGVGFNIASGKIGPRTIITSCRKSDNFASEVVLDLEDLIRRGEYVVPGREVPKPEGMEQGTIIKITGTYATGHQNAEFASKIAAISGNLVLEQLGRRYATCIKEKNIAIRVYETSSNSKLVKPSEHCVWSENRTTAAMAALSRQQVPAQIWFDESLGSFKRCVECGRYIPDGVKKCEIETHLQAPQTVESKVRGWVGIQRFDSTDRFGIDLIRNGRTIVRDEKSFFFEITDENGNKIKEYPLDDITGRIVGEVHLDGCRVDYLKQQFQVDAMFEKAITFLRGKALRPQGPKGQQGLAWEDGYVNDSPISKLYSAYNRVRFTSQASSPKDVLYPAAWDPVRKQPKRIGRDWEGIAYENFLNKEDGWFDDANWYERVEFGGLPPQQGMRSCPQCDHQNDPAEEQCEQCTLIFDPKMCVSCENPILPSASSCPLCGTAQWGVDNSDTDWECPWCSYKTPSEEVICGQCGHNRGSPAPLTEEALENDSSRWDEFCFENLSIPLTSSQSSRELFVQVFKASNPIKARWDSPATLPVVVHKHLTEMKIFVDSGHNLFTELQAKPQTLIANEVASFILSLHPPAPGDQAFNLSSTTFKILQEYFGDYADTSVNLVDEVNQFFADIADRLRENGEVQEFYNNLSGSDKQAIATELQLSGELEKHSINELVDNGWFLSFMPKRFFADFFNEFPDVWIEKIWLRYEPPDAEILGQDNAEMFHKVNIGFLQSALVDCGALADTPENYLDEDKIGRAATGLQVLQKKAYA